MANSVQSLVTSHSVPSDQVTSSKSFVPVIALRLKSSKRRPAVNDQTSFTYSLFSANTAVETADSSINGVLP
ncbi:Uncharacterised protein [Vibrio cholerae]|nr:Uncharacterised protein [Vibrio cholerae]